MRSHWITLLLWGVGSGSARAKAQDACVDASMVAHEGAPVGTEEIVDGVTLYITKPEGEPKAAVLYLTDVFGIQLVQNKLLADSFARAGYLTVAPDLFNGTPAKADINISNLAAATFLAAHDASDTDAIVAKAVAYLRDTAGAKRVAATGYCFGGRFAFRVAAEGKGADAAFAAHPANLEDGEITAVKGPASVAAAETDSMMSPERRGEIEALLLKAGVPYQFALYSGTSHGFGVRANISDPQQKFGKESAFLQAVRWFDTWVATE
ncbi:alpha/beta-hydrolase [Phialemonium atrogriseum]|uniref:Alpha/beta-hydrolase n=1 Tax=Phialemonium atrogriseum TaxID=1093897 RepID=A0AAJ0FMM9_9PEZI|nr:alpha/beta-hydrolase [Phialemonium atrogriseum]KAK1768029.1 alpha/beta-hydrolase [Phialemonium atrogriseum]